MEKPYIFKVATLIDTLNQLAPLALDHIYLQVGEDVVNEETHMLAEKHDLPEIGALRVVSKTAHLASPGVLEIKLHALDREQQAE
jgi:hypothetical protein